MARIQLKKVNEKEPNVSLVLRISKEISRIAFISSIKTPPYLRAATSFTISLREKMTKIKPKRK